MGRHTVMTHALNQGGTPRMVMDIAPHVWPEGTSPVRVNLVKTEAAYRACILCGGEPLYRVVWATPGAWYGDTHWERYCFGCVMGRGVAEGWVRVSAPLSLAKASDRVLAVWERELIEGADAGLSLDLSALPGHRGGLRANDPITLASFLEIASR